MSDTSPGGAGPAPRSSARRWAISGAAALGLYALLGFVVVPRIIAWQVRRQAVARLHRRATLASARFNPFTFSATLIGLDLRDRDSTPLVAFDTLVVNLSLGSVPRRALVLDEFRLVRPAITARLLADGKPAIADLLTADSGRAATDSAAALPRLVVHQASIRGGSIAIVDLSRSPAYQDRLEDLGLVVDGLSTLPRENGDHVLTVSLEKGAEIRWTGASEIQPLLLKGKITVSHINVPRLTRVLGSSLPFTVSAGTGDVSFNYEVTRGADGGFLVKIPEAGARFAGVTLKPNEASQPGLQVATTLSATGTVKLGKGEPRVAFDGNAALEGFALSDTAGGPLLAWKGMAIENIHYTAGPDLLRIRTIRFVEPFARIAISREREINLMALNALMPPPDTTKPLPYEIQEILLNDARIDFSDLSLLLPFRAMIDSARGAIRDVASFGGTPGSLEFTGRIAPNGAAKAKGTLHLSDPFAATRVVASFRNVDMTQLTPYSAEFAGYAIKQGRLDVAIDYRIQNRQLEAGHKIVATNLTLGEKVEGGGAPGFLVKLAVSLLKDSQGRIKFDVPVQGSVDDPRFSYSSVIWQGVKQVLGKVATAPFRFLGGLLGIKKEDVDLVEFDPGRSELLAPDQETLDSIAAELGRRPELILKVEGRYDSVADPAATREALLEAKIAAQRGASSARPAARDTSSTVLGGILEALYVQQFSPVGLDSLKSSFTAADSALGRPEPRLNASAYYEEVRARLLAAQPVPADLLPRLGQERAGRIVATLTAGGRLDSTRVAVAGVGPVSRKKAGSNRVASELKMDAR